MSNRVKEMRLKLGWSQRMLAERSHLSQSNVSDVERNRRTPWPSLKKKLARALKVEQDFLFPTSEQN